MATKKRARRAAGKPKPKPRKAARPRGASALPTRAAGGRRKPSRPARRTSRPAPRATATIPRTPAAAAAPNAIGAVHQHVDYTSHALDQVQRFYTEVLGFEDFRFDPATPYLSVRTGPSSSLGFMPPVPGPPEQWRPPREPALYLHVRDVDRAHQKLVARGVVFEQEPTNMPWNHRVAILRDPEGRTVMLAQPIEP